MAQRRPLELSAMGAVRPPAEAAVAAAQRRERQGFDADLVGRPLPALVPAARSGRRELRAAGRRRPGQPARLVRPGAGGRRRGRRHARHPPRHRRHRPGAPPPGVPRADRPDPRPRHAAGASSWASGRARRSTSRRSASEPAAAVAPGRGPRAPAPADGGDGRDRLRRRPLPPGGRVDGPAARCRRRAAADLGRGPPAARPGAGRTAAPTAGCPWPPIPRTTPRMLAARARRRRRARASRGRGDAGPLRPRRRGRDARGRPRGHRRVAADALHRPHAPVRGLRGPRRRASAGRRASSASRPSCRPATTARRPWGSPRPCRCRCCATR